MQRLPSLPGAQQARHAPLRPPLRCGLADILFGLCSGNGAGSCVFSLILGRGQFGLSIIKLASQVIELGTKLGDLDLGGRQ